MDEEIDSSSSVKVALKIAAAVVGLLIALVALRFGFDVCIDACILGETERARRNIAELWRRMFPWWNRRVESDQRTPAEQYSRSVGGISVGTGGPSEPTLTKEQRAEMALSLLMGKVLTAEDVRCLHQDCSDGASGGPHSAGGPVVCSICLYDFIEGDDSLSAKCHHIYHRHCLIEWMASHGGTVCPNCRTELISPPEQL